MQQRYYDPVIGRFYSNDPVDMLGHMQRGNPAMGFNRYAYANNNPYKYTDPDGEFVQYIAAAVVIVAVIVVNKVGDAFDKAAEQVNKDMERAEDINKSFTEGDYQGGFEKMGQDNEAFTKEVLPAVADLAESAAKNVPGTSFTGPAMTGPNDAPTPSSVIVDEVVKGPIKDAIVENK